MALDDDLPFGFVPTKPSMPVASEAFQFLLELSRRQPQNAALQGYKMVAYALLHDLWREHQGLPPAPLVL